MTIVRLRLLALAIDVALLVGAALFFKLGLLYLWPLQSTSWLSLTSLTIGYVTLTLLFYGAAAGILRASPGKHILGLKLSAIDGDSLTFFRAALRENLRLCEVVFFISGFFSFLNLLESRPTATDAFFRTYVRDKRR
jgi:uncharacterized RDD family membrane protein YckC